MANVSSCEDKLYKWEKHSWYLKEHQKGHKHGLNLPKNQDWYDSKQEEDNHPMKKENPREQNCTTSQARRITSLSANQNITSTRNRSMVTHQRMRRVFLSAYCNAMETNIHDIKTCPKMRKNL